MRARLRSHWFVLLAGAVAVACSDANGPPESPGALPALNVVSGVPQTGVFEICKVGSAADFEIEIVANNPFHGSTVITKTERLLDGECKVVHTDTDGLSDVVTITEIIPTGFSLDFVEVLGIDGQGTVTSVIRPGPGVSGEITASKLGCVAIFHNVPEPELPCSDCRGGVTELTLRNNGPDAVIQVKAGKKIVFDEFVAAGAEFSFVGQGRDNKLGKEIKIRANGGPETKIHTSCSRPIGPGSVFGDFEVVEAFSKDGGRVCPAGQEEDCDDLCDAGKPRVAMMEFTGADCSATSNSQDPTKISCADFGVLPATVRIVASDKENPDDTRAKTWFDGTVALNGTFGIDATNAGANRLKANTWVHIYALDGTLLQSVKFHTSCSQPLELGDQFGSLSLVDFTPDI